MSDVFSINEFANIRGTFGGDYKDVCFIRMLGMNSTYTDEIRQMDSLLSEQASKGQMRYQRLSELPRLVSSEDVNYYSGCYDNWTAGGRKTLELKVSAQNGLLKEVLGTACSEAVRLFGQVTPHASASMEKNFAVKLMFWADQTAKELLDGFQPGNVMKLVISNASKKQEYLFASFMTMLGADVMLLQYQSDIDAQLERLNLSKKVQLGAFGVCTLPVYQPYVPAPAVPPHTERRNNRSAVTRERKPLEVRVSGTGARTNQEVGRPGSAASRTGQPQRNGSASQAQRNASGAVQIQRNTSGVGSSRRTGPRRELDFEELMLNPN